MKKIVLLLITILIAIDFPAFSQDPQKIDSLRQLLNNQPVDSFRVRLFSAIGQEYIRVESKLDTGKLYVDSLMSLSKKNW